MEQEPMPITHEPLIPGSDFYVRKDIMVPMVGYDPTHHTPDTYYRLVVNPLTGASRLKLQSEIDTLRADYRSQHGRT